MRALLLTVALTSGAGALVSASPADGPFLAENNAAMAKMMKAMGVKATGNADKDFVATMVPHHQGAIDMSIAIQRYAHNDQPKHFAQEIIVTQQQETAAMRPAVGEPLPPSV